jgi:hypothetical protein
VIAPVFSASCFHAVRPAPARIPPLYPLSFRNKFSVLDIFDQDQKEN